MYVAQAYWKLSTSKYFANIILLLKVSILATGWDLFKVGREETDLCIHKLTFHGNSGIPSGPGQGWGPLWAPGHGAMQEVIQKIHTRSPFVFKEDEGFFFFPLSCESPKFWLLGPRISNGLCWRHCVGSTLLTIGCGCLLGSWEVSRRLIKWIHDLFWN